MNGCEVPEGLRMIDFGNLIILPIFIVGQGYVKYQLRDWFVAPGKPTIKYMGIVGADDDELIELGRKVLC